MGKAGKERETPKWKQKKPSFERQFIATKSQKKEKESGQLGQQKIEAKGTARGGAREGTAQGKKRQD